MADLPTKIVAIWSGAIVDIPAKWAICDGNNGTPDLRDRFIVGAGSTYAPNDGGGDETHLHSFQSDGHFHDLPGDSEDVDGGAVRSKTTFNSVLTGNTDRSPSMPPYLTLAYIMVKE